MLKVPDWSFMVKSISACSYGSEDTSYMHISQLLTNLWPMSPAHASPGTVCRGEWGPAGFRGLKRRSFQILSTCQSVWEVKRMNILFCWYKSCFLSGPKPNKYFDNWPRICIFKYFLPLGATPDVNWIVAPYHPTEVLLHLSAARESQQLSLKYCQYLLHALVAITWKLGPLFWLTGLH